MSSPVAILLSVLGAILGSFANVCIWRLPRGESIAWPPSHCVHCNKPLKPWHLVPIFSWLFLKGKCAMCGGKVSFRYFVVELSTAVIFGAVGWQWGISLLTLRYCILTLALIIAVGTDLSHQEIPDQVSLGTSALLGIIALVTLSWGNLIGGVLLFCLLLLIAMASRGGMGGGDIKLALGIGLALGWKLGLVTLAVAFLAGGLLAVVLMIRGKRGKAIPFGPFLALGAWVAMFFGDALLDLYVAFSLSLWSW
jgi:leader peptidase (prepilin peptidase)/N-methyltransferase